jgi:hypothetical protein
MAVESLPDVEHRHIEELGRNLDRRLLEIARKVDPNDEIAGDFCRAGFRDIAANLKAVDPNAPEQDFSELTEEAMPNLPFYQEKFAGIKRQIYQAMKAIGKIN